MTNRRQFLTRAGAVTIGAAGAATLSAPAIVRAQTAIKWRFQTYAGAALGEHVTKPIIDAINATAKGELEIELYFADQIVPTGELFRALQAGTIDAASTDAVNGAQLFATNTQVSTNTTNITKLETSVGALQDDALQYNAKIGAYDAARGGVPSRRAPAIPRAR